jgi:hypothetical protein
MTNAHPKLLNLTRILLLFKKWLMYPLMHA